MRTRLHKARTRLGHWWLVFQIERLHVKTWGRQKDGGVIMPAGGVRAGVKGKSKATIRARVYRAATGEWDDYGVVAGNWMDVAWSRLVRWGRDVAARLFAYAKRLKEQRSRGFPWRR